MIYAKPALFIDEQVSLLKARGLIIKDEEEAKSNLSNISFYRLRAYTYPFQDNNNPDHPFIAQISFGDIIRVYDFDRHLRLIVIDAIEKIEISLRTQIIYNWSINHGSHWHLNSSLFRGKYSEITNRLNEEVKRSREEFIKHYRTKYTSPPLEPPCWMSLEVGSFGLLSIIFQHLKNGSEKKQMVKFYGLNSVDVLENWLHAISDIRNLCAHHSRLWNRRLITHIKMPTHPSNAFIVNKSILLYKVYAALCCVKYLVDVISPENNFRHKLLQLINDHSHTKISLKEMGFPDNWQSEVFWN